MKSLEKEFNKFKEFIKNISENLSDIRKSELYSNVSEYIEDELLSNNLNICKSCKKHNKDYDYGEIICCTVDENGFHHSYNDEPAVIYRGGPKYWYKHGKSHRENGPSSIYNSGTAFFCYENKDSLRTNNKPINNIITINDNSIAIILKQMKKPYNNVYLCLIDNEKRYIRCLNEH